MGSMQENSNIWAQMSYTPPRGPCSQKLSILTSCPCFRFMIHPLKASTSFDCDGCGHHASYHRMQNEHDEGIAKRWKEQEAERAKARETERWRNMDVVMNGIEEAAPRRKRLAAPPSPVETEIVHLLEETEEEKAERPELATAGVGRKRKGRA